MAQLFAELTEPLQQFIREQKMFFVGSAPLSGDGLINISPKAAESFRILDTKTVAYLDLTGSGVESIAHLRENGRFVVMFCSFDRSPKILRLHGTGEVIDRSHPDWLELKSQFADVWAARAIIRLGISRIADSCGWTVPMYSFEGTRSQYPDYMKQLDDDGLLEIQLQHCQSSIDGLPALEEQTIRAGHARLDGRSSGPDE